MKQLRDLFSGGISGSMLVLQSVRVFVVVMKAHEDLC